MYERKIPVDLGCPLRLTMSLIDSKWKSCTITPLGMTLIPIIDAMIDWGNRNTGLFEKKYGG